MLYFLTFPVVAWFETNAETLLFACANFFINWLWYKCSLDSGLFLKRVKTLVKSKADHSWNSQ